MQLNLFWLWCRLPCLFGASKEPLLEGLTWLGLRSRRTRGCSTVGHSLAGEPWRSTSLALVIIGQGLLWSALSGWWPHGDGVWGNLGLQHD